MKVSTDGGGNMKTDEEKRKDLLFINLDHLVQRSFLALVQPKLSFNSILELLDKELKIANCALKSKKKPDYEFKTIKVNFKRIRSGCIILSSLSGYTMNLNKEQGVQFDEWVQVPMEEKQRDYDKYIRLGNKELGYTTYRLYDSDEAMERMREKDRNNHHYDILNGVADTVLEKK